MQRKETFYVRTKDANNPTEMKGDLAFNGFDVGGPTGLLFPGDRTDHMSVRYLMDRYRPAREAAGRPDLTIHHLRHTALAARVCRSDRALDAGLRATAASQRVFDDLVELGLGRGRLTPTILAWMARSMAGSAGRRARPLSRTLSRTGGSWRGHAPNEES